MRGLLRFFEDLFFGILKQGAVAIDPGTAMLISAGISGGAGLLGGFLGGKGGDEEFKPYPLYTPQPSFFQAPDPRWFGAPTPEQYEEFPEAKEARETWFGRLQEWGDMPGYGAIAPDWGDIWEQAQQKVKQYYWGGPGGQPGLAGKIKASAARRGVAQSPALERQLTRMGGMEAGDISRLATEQATQQAQFAETGRQSWLQNLQAMAGMRPGFYQPAGQFQQSLTSWQQPMSGYVPGAQPELGPLVGELGSAVGQAGMQTAQMKWLEDLMKSTGTQPYSIGEGRTTSPLYGQYGYIGQ